MLSGPRPSRRGLLVAGAGALVVAAIGELTRSHASQTVAKDRPNWHFCHKCQVMFYTGDYPAQKGACAAGGIHEQRGYHFYLPFDGAETPTAQTNWRRCQKCQAMFYNGYQSKGRCAAGGAHGANTTFKYVLPHSVRESSKAQKNWRYCSKCQAMFYDGYQGKGRCAAGEAHVAQGLNFVLPHKG